MPGFSLRLGMHFGVTNGSILSYEIHILLTIPIATINRFFPKPGSRMWADTSISCGAEALNLIMRFAVASAFFAAPAHTALPI